MPPNAGDDSASTSSPNQTESPTSTANTDHEEPSDEKLTGRFVIVSPDERPAEQTSAQTLRSLHPYTRPLTIADVDSCVALENAAFDNEAERCTPEKFRYRLTKCGELSLGLFCTATPESKLSASTLGTGRPVETSRKNGAVSVLLGHIVATKSRKQVVTDEAMDFPRDWEGKEVGDVKVGHHEDGRTICIHSLGVLPQYQRSGLGRTLLMAYMQQMNGAGIADRLALIAHEHLIPYYEKMGFVNHGASKAQFGGGGWYDMIFELKPIEARTAYG